ncbi:hypothetical protein OSTOST_17813, partial [Ostertagia ostertagi]
MTKKVEEIRIPSIRYPSIYHDPTKISALPEVTIMKPGNVPSVLTTVRVGPYPTIEEFTSESKSMVVLVYLSSDVISRHVCLTTLSICESGFTFPETNFASKVMESEHSCEVVEDHSKKHAACDSACFGLYCGVYMALFNGAPDLALRAIDAMHQRAQYEILAEVVLKWGEFSCEQLINSRAFDPMLSHPRAVASHDWSYCKEKLRKGLVTTASLRIRKMPEDIPIQPELKEKEHSIIEEDGVETILQLHIVELQTIREEKTSDGGDVIQRLEEIAESPHPSNKVVEMSYRKESIGIEDYNSSKQRKSSINEEKKEDRCRNGINEKEKEQADSPVVERPEQLYGERRISSSEDSGTYTVSGLRHMDSGSSTQRNSIHSTVPSMGQIEQK